MALIRCPECGNDVSDKAPSCIHCGYPFPPKQKNVIRRCTDGQIILEKENITFEQAELYIRSITERSAYKFSFKCKSGSKYEIVDSDEELDYVRELKSVIRVVNGSNVVLGENLSLKEAESYKRELESKYNATYVIIDANRSVDEFEFKTPGTATIACPRCGSSFISTGSRGYSILTGFWGSGKTVNRCGKCGYTWKP